MPAASTSSCNDMSDINREVNTDKDRLTLDLIKFKKQLETQSRVEVECAKQNLKTEFKHELRQQTLTHMRTIDSLNK